MNLSIDILVNILWITVSRWILTTDSFHYCKAARTSETEIHYVQVLYGIKSRQKSTKIFDQYSYDFEGSSERSTHLLESPVLLASH